MGDPPLAMCKFWPAGVLPPVVNEKDSEVGVGVNTGCALTVSVTGTTTLLDACVELMVTDPLYGCTVNPAVFTETLMGPGVVPPGVTVNHDGPDAVKDNPSPPVRLMLCAAGAVPSN